MIKNLFNPKTALLAGSLFLALSIGMSSCQKDDWCRKKYCHVGNGGVRDTTRQKDSTEQRDSSGRDSSNFDEACRSIHRTLIDDVDISNGQTFAPTDVVSLKVDVTAANGCAQFANISESRSVNGNTVDIYLSAEVTYEGCICTEALVPLTSYFEVSREPSTNSMTYIVHYTDATTQKEVQKYFYY